MAKLLEKAKRKNATAEEPKTSAIQELKIPDIQDAEDEWISVEEAQFLRDLDDAQGAFG